MGRYGTSSEEAREKMIKIAQESMVKGGGKEKRKILDVGCGDGILYPYLEDASGPQGFDYVGVDLSHEMISQAKRSRRSGTFQQADFFEFDLKEEEKVGGII